jgi:hypothetical protein
VSTLEIPAQEHANDIYLNHKLVNSDGKSIIIYTLRYGLKITRKINRKICAACKGDDCKCKFKLIGIKPSRLDELMTAALKAHFAGQMHRGTVGTIYDYFTSTDLPPDFTILLKLLETNQGTLDHEFMKQTLNYDLNKILNYDYPCFDSRTNAQGQIATCDPLGKVRIIPNPDLPNPDQSNPDQQPPRVVDQVDKSGCQISPGVYDLDRDYCKYKQAKSMCESQSQKKYFPYVSPPKEKYSTIWFGRESETRETDKICNFWEPCSGNTLGTNLDIVKDPVQLTIRKNADNTGYQDAQESYRNCIDDGYTGQCPGFPYMKPTPLMPWLDQETNALYSGIYDYEYQQLAIENYHAEYMKSTPPSEEKLAYFVGIDFPRYDRYDTSDNISEHGICMDNLNTPKRLFGHKYTPDLEKTDIVAGNIDRIYTNLYSNGLEGKENKYKTNVPEGSPRPPCDEADILNNDCHENPLNPSVPFETSFLFSGTARANIENLHFASIFYPDVSTNFFYYLDKNLLEWAIEKGCDLKYKPQWLRMIDATYSEAAMQTDGESMQVFNSVRNEHLR